MHRLKHPTVVGVFVCLTLLLAGTALGTRLGLPRLEALYLTLLLLVGLSVLAHRPQRVPVVQRSDDDHEG